MILRVFPRRTSFTPVDEYAFVGDPPMIRPSFQEGDEVHVSCTFTWDREEAVRLLQAWAQFYPVVKIGGPAIKQDNNGFIPGRYVKPGVTFTTRGCNNRCPWCLVPEREGRLKLLNIAPGHIIQDNNLLQAPRYHIERVFDMLKGQKAIQFSGGLDARLLTQEIADQIRSLRVYQVFLACDTKEAIVPLRQAIQRLNLPRQRIRCYVLLRFNPQETISEATERLIGVYEAGCLPFAQLYLPPSQLTKYSLEWSRLRSEWRRLARTWSRPAAMKSVMKIEVG